MAMWVMMAAAAAQAGGAAPAAPAPVRVMVLGSYHFGNPGRDRINIHADDVTAPRRQHELEVLADEIAAFHPTRVMVEEEVAAPDHDVPDYRRFTPAMLARERGEDVQIGYRIAARLGLAAVQGIDEQGKPGRPDYFPADKLDAWAKAHGQEARLAAAFAPMQAAADRMAGQQATTSIPQSLISHNDPATPQGGQSVYYTILPIGAGEEQPGADLNAGWYLRNAKIFAKLAQVARPGDRVLVVYGAGHGYWLRHFAANTPGFEAVDVLPYLRRAAARLAQGQAPR